MIAPLRRSHRFIWFCMPPLLLAAVIISLIVRGPAHAQPSSQPDPSSSPSSSTSGGAR